MGKLLKGEEHDMTEVEIEKILRVRPDAIKVLGDAIVKAPIAPKVEPKLESPKREKSNKFHKNI